MNTTHHSIWNAALGAWVAVSEITRACGKRRGAAVALVLIGSSVCSSVGAQIFIDGGVRTVSGGSVWTTNGDLTVGVGGTGELTVGDGGFVSVGMGNNDGVIDVAQFAGSTGKLNIGAAPGSAAQAAGTVGAGLLRFGAGTGSLNFNHTDAAYVFGVPITGAGVLNQIAGTTILTGANTYSGATTISAGNLRVGNGGTTGTLGSGAVQVDAGAALSFNRSDNIAVGNNINGAGGVWQDGGGTLTLTGTNTYSGATTISAGTLRVGNGGTTGTLGSGAVQVSNGAALSFNRSDNIVVGNNINGAGGVRQDGGGTLTLTGTNSYSGATNVNAGTLSVNGSIANSAVTVNSGGILGGNGTLGSTTIASGGVLAPGNSIGTLTVNGNLSFAAGSIYRVEVDAVGNNDRINATGTVTINGGTVDVQAGAGNYAANTTYTILNAAGGRTGNFVGVTSNLAFLTPTLGYDANNVFLTLARNSTSFNAATVAITPNQIATSTALQNAVTGASGDMSTVINAVTGLSAAQARAAYDSASGAGLGALRNVGGSFAAGFGRQLQARLGTVQGGASTQVGAFAGGPILLAANDRVSDLMAPVSDSPQKFSLAGGTSSASSSVSQQGRGFWLRGSGSQQSTGSDGNVAASKLRNGGIGAGFDAEVGEGLVIGAALSSGTSRLSFDNRDAGKSRGSALAVYGSYASGPWAFKGSASAAWNSNHMDRAVTVGALNRTASSDFDSNTLSAYGEATYSIPMNGWALQPLAALSLSRNKVDGFTETGAGALNLQVAGQTATSTKSLLGAKASVEAGSVRLEPRVIWAHEFGDLNTPMTAQFQGAATASPFQVSGAALKRDTLILGLGASGSISKGLDLFADVQAEHNSRQSNLAALVGLRARW